MEAPEQFFELSRSVQGAIEALPESDEPVSAWMLVAELFRIHPEYADGLARKLADEPEPEGSEHRDIDAWVGAAGSMYVRDRVPVLNGRLFILALAQLDPALRGYLENYGVLAPLQDEAEKEAGSTFIDLLINSARFAQSVSVESPAEGVKDVVAATRAATAIAGYISDSVDAEAEDLLDIEHEVANIAHVLTAKRVTPPLSLGLFGDWGSGKSFFMAKLRRYIAQIADHYSDQERNEGTPSEWCSRVLQIEFNAWHFSDAELWPSIVTHIYGALDAELQEQQPSDRLVRQRLAQRIEAVQGEVDVAQKALEQARQRVSAKANELEQARRERREQENKLSQQLDNIVALLREDKQLRTELDRAAKALGVPEAAQAYQKLEALHADLHTLNGGMRATAAQAIRTPRMLLLLALLLIGLPPLVNWLLVALDVSISEIGRLVVDGSSLLVGALAWAQLQVRKGAALIDTVNQGLARARSQRELEIETSSEVQTVNGELAASQSRERAAQSNLDSAQRELEQLSSELAEMRPERKLQKLIAERSDSGLYSSKLGIISAIRADFQRMSDLLRDLAAEKRDLKTEEPPIQRIVLYIDDLDRCRPERVVEVLEAVHLLLAFPLFMVVVGVDPRWLRHSLVHHYQHTLGAGRVANDGESGFSTPQDYLEKIFQIPFALRPVEKGGYGKLVSELLKPLPDSASHRGIPMVVQKAEFVTLENGKPIVKQTLDAADGQVTFSGGFTATRVEEPSFSPIDSQQLDFRDWESKDIERLWPLFRTPRTIKRFVNSYRILRAGVVARGELDLFEGSPEAPGVYQVALLLLAIIASASNQTASFLQRLGEWLNQNIDHADEPIGWSELFATLREDLLQDDPHWRELLAQLDRVVAKNFSRKMTPTELREWGWRVARYSFSVRPAQELALGLQRRPQEPGVEPGESEAMALDE